MRAGQSGGGCRYLPAVADAASDKDRGWFERNPNRHHCVRPLVPGEMPLRSVAGDGRWFVLVKRVLPGMRARLPVYLYAAPPDSEEAAEWLFRMAFRGHTPAGPT